MSVKQLNTQEFLHSVADWEHLTDQGLPQFKSARPVVVDVFASWCHPCQRFAPVFEQVASEMEGKADFYKVDIDMNPGFSRYYNIRSVPTVLFFSSNGAFERHVGVLSAQELRMIVDRRC